MTIVKRLICAFCLAMLSTIAGCGVKHSVGDKSDQTELKKESAANGGDTTNPTTRKKASAANLKELGLALHAFAADRKQLPPAAVCDKDGKPLLSWRVALLPFLGQTDLYKQFRLDLPWDDPHNLKLVEKMPKVFEAPGITPKEPGLTYYRGFASTSKTPAPDQVTVWWGVAKPSLGTKLSQITDGLDNTIMLVEAKEPTVWTKPGELPFGDGAHILMVGGVFKDGLNALFASNSVRFCGDIREDIFRALLTRDGKEALPDDIEALLRPTPDESGEQKR